MTVSRRPLQRMAASASRAGREPTCWQATVPCGRGGHTILLCAEGYLGILDPHPPEVRALMAMQGIKCKADRALAETVCALRGLGPATVPSDLRAGVRFHRDRVNLRRRACQGEMSRDPLATPFAKRLRWRTSMAVHSAIEALAITVRCVRLASNGGTIRPSVRNTPIPRGRHGRGPDRTQATVEHVPPTWLARVQLRGLSHAVCHGLPVLVLDVEPAGDGTYTAWAISAVSDKPGKGRLLEGRLVRSHGVWELERDWRRHRT